jgi:hypothetical protein
VDELIEQVEEAAVAHVLVGHLEEEEVVEGAVVPVDVDEGAGGATTLNHQPQLNLTLSWTSTSVRMQNNLKLQCYVERWNN